MVVKQNRCGISENMLQFSENNKTKTNTKTWKHTSEGLEARISTTLVKLGT